MYTCVDVPAHAHGSVQIHKYIRCTHTVPTGGFCSETRTTWVCRCRVGSGSSISSSSPARKSLTIPASPGFTAALWLRSDAVAEAGFRTVFQCSPDGAAAPHMLLSFDPTENRAQYAVYTASSPPAVDGVAEERASGLPYSSSTWVHYAVRHTSAGVASLYRDGYMVKTSSVAYPWNGETAACSFGTGHVLAGNFTGDVMLAYYWQGVLSEASIMSTRSKGSPQHLATEGDVYGAVAEACRDVDECALGTHTCSALKACTNTEGSFMCECMPGYTSYYATCRDVNECSSSTRCPAHLECVNVPGSFFCVCPSGFWANSTSLNGSQAVSMSGLSTMGSAGVSVSAWLRVSDAADNQTVVECMDPYAGTVFLALAFHSRANAVRYMVSDASSMLQAQGTPSTYVGTWTHVAVTHASGQSVKIYRDGALAASGSLPYGFGGRLATCQIGRSVQGLTAGARGAVQGVNMWMEAITAAEVRENHFPVVLIGGLRCCALRGPVWLDAVTADDVS